MGKPEFNIRAIMEGNKPRSWGGFLKLTYLRDILILLVLGLLFWKLLNAKFEYNFSDFRFTDFLSVILAISAITLSAMFYFKATDTSNRFYDNSYKFTREVSEILGRIEAGFGERLRHLDEGYTAVRDRVDRLPIDVNETKKKIDEDKEKIKSKEMELNSILDDLRNRDFMEKGERQALIDRLKETQDELNDSNKELKRMKDKLYHIVDNSFQGLFASMMTDLDARPDDLTPDGLNKLFQTHKENNIPSDILDAMKKHSVLRRDGTLTNKGCDILLKAIRSWFHDDE